MAMLHTLKCNTVEPLTDTKGAGKRPGSDDLSINERGSYGEVLLYFYFL